METITVHIRRGFVAADSVCGVTGPETVSVKHYIQHIEVFSTDECCNELYKRICPECMAMLGILRLVGEK